MSPHKIALCLFIGFTACQSKVEVIDPPPPPPPQAKPAALKLDAALSAPRATLGQQLTLTLTVTNTGESVALGLTPSPLSQGGTGRVRIVSSAADGTVDLAPAAQHAFELTLETTDPGELLLGALVEAMDGPSGASIAAEMTELELAIESPPLLVIDATGAPAAADVGQPVEVSVTVVNEGEAAARLVAVQLDAVPGSVAFDRVSGPTPVAAVLKAGDTQAFRFVITPTAAGNLLMKAHAFGIDDNDSAALASEEVTLPSIGVERPAKLVAELVLPDVATTGQAITATLVVRNDGEALAVGVLPVPALPVATTVSGTASASATVAPAAIDVPGGSTATFTWTYVASGAGTFSLAARVRGAGVNSGAVVEASAPAVTAQVIAPSALQVTELSAPAMLNPTQQFDVTVKVKNAGGAAANGVLPDPLPPTMLAADGALARLVTSPAAQNIAPGAIATFVFHYAENGTGPGSLRFSAGARGVDAVSGAALSAVVTQSNLVLVRPVPALVIDQVTLPAKLSRGQAFAVQVKVRNAGGTPATNVKPALTFVAGADALAAVNGAPIAPVTLAGGASVTFTLPCDETGSGTGTLRARATASGTNPSFGNALAAAAVLSAVPATLVQQPASLQVVTFLLPASLNRGARFSLGMVVSNGGQADARLVAPTAPSVAVTGGVTVALVTGPVSLTIPGSTSRTFTWTYREGGTAAGTLGFNAAATGLDANSSVTVNAAAAASNVSSIEAYLGCNGSLMHPALDGHLLDADRLELAAGSDRLRVKSYSALPDEFTRAFGTQPASIRGQGNTFDVPTARWSGEQELSAISLYRAFIAGYQACVTLTAGPAQYAVAPTASTATAECRAWQRRFWSVTPGAAETAACANFAVSADNDGATAREKWAATCATAAASLGFLAE